MAEGPGPRQRARLDALRAQWLRPPGPVDPPGRWLVLASPDAGGAASLRDGVAGAARDLQLPLAWAPRGGRLQGEAGAAVVAVDLGVVDGRCLDALGESRAGCDLLLWGGPVPGPRAAWCSYLLACLASRLLPRQLACAGGESVDEVANGELSQRLGELGVPVEACPARGRPGRERARHWLAALLRAAATVGLLLLLAPATRAQDGGARERPPLVELVVAGLDPGRVRERGSGRLWSGSRYAVHLGRAQATWNADSTRVHVVLPRADLAMWMDERPFPWRDEQLRIDGRLQLLAPQLAIVAHSGRLAMSGNTLELTLDGGPTPGDQRQGWALALGMGIVILLLLWRGSVARRQLAEPRTPLRSRDRG